VYVSLVFKKVICDNWVCLSHQLQAVVRVISSD